ncbi:MAG TPA: pyruvate kinase [bacterium]|nr:pyruvate kinase [bacterium]
MQNKFTKIVCTIGPASESEETINKLYLAGMNVARLNFKHGDYDWFKTVIKRIRAVSKKHGEPIAILQDLQGPDIRTGKLVDGKPVMLEAEKPFFLTSQKIIGSVSGVSISISNLNKHLAEGDKVLIDDGAIELIVERVDRETAHCEVISGGKLGERKGINIPGKRPTLDPLSNKDRQDIAFAIEQKLDFIALSFAQSAADVLALRQELDNSGVDIAKYMQIISKIESVLGLKNFDEILKVSDGIMIARGDLGIELPIEEIPSIQKELIQKCNRAGKPVITATQMLDSMEENPLPTRAEASDVANAVLDNTDALMLSGETANGKYPVGAVLTMAKLVKFTEQKIRDGILQRKENFGDVHSTTESVAKQACDLAKEVGAKLILTLTTSGTTTRNVSRFRPGIPIKGASPYGMVQRQLLLVHGVAPDCIRVHPDRNFKVMTDEAVEIMKKKDHVVPGDIIIVTAGIKGAYQAGGTNLVYVHTVE